MNYIRSYPGYFITFEGGEGAGKSTQIKRLQSVLESRGREVVLTREPGGTPEAEKIRDLVVQRDGGAWNPMEECLLFYAARHNHVEALIKPALEAGKIVLCDRFSDSTLVYQGYGHGLDVHELYDLHTLVLGAFKPNLTFIMDIDPAIGLERTELRLAEATGTKVSTEDRFERLDFSFHKRLRTGFLDVAKHEPERCVLMDASMDVDELAAQIEEVVLDRLGA